MIDAHRRKSTSSIDQKYIPDEQLFFNDNIPQHRINVWRFGTNLFARLRMHRIAERSTSKKTFLMNSCSARRDKKSIEIVLYHVQRSHRWSLSRTLTNFKNGHILRLQQILGKVRLQS